MDTSERKRRDRRQRNGCSRNRRSMIGGTYTAAWSFPGPLVPGLGNAGEVRAITECGNPVRPAVNPGPPGLPGLSGGRRRKQRRSTRRLNLNVIGEYANTNQGAQNRLQIANNEVLAPLEPKNTMVGGRWGFLNPEVVGPAGIALGGRDHIACEPSVHNSLNPGGATPTTVPQRGGVGGPDSMFYRAPTAGYTNVPSDQLGSASGTLYDGKTPFMVQVPYEARASNPACGHTGGRRKSRRTKRTKRKSSRKTRGRRRN
jgi:hypothetical protein